MIPENELLDLLDKTKQEQKQWAIDKYLVKVIGSTGGADDETVYESLADLAERLWEMAYLANIHSPLLDNAIVRIYENTTGIRVISKADKITMLTWWLEPKKIIHRTVAALIALGRAGVDVTKEEE
jgi:hypothetical protein